MTKREKVKILKGMRARLEKPGGWVKGTFRRTNYDRQEADGSYRIGYCLAGAAYAAARDEDIPLKSGMSEADLVRELSIDALATAKLASTRAYQDDPSAFDEPGHGTFTFNDARTTRKKDVLALVDEKLAELAS